MIKSQDTRWYTTTCYWRARAIQKICPRYRITPIRSLDILDRLSTPWLFRPIRVLHAKAHADRQRLSKLYTATAPAQEILFLLSFPWYILLLFICTVTLVRCMHIYYILCRLLVLFHFVPSNIIYNFFKLIKVRCVRHASWRKTLTSAQVVSVGSLD